MLKNKGKAPLSAKSAWETSCSASGQEYTILSFKNPWKCHIKILWMLSPYTYCSSVLIFLYSSVNGLSNVKLDEAQILLAEFSLLLSFLTQPTHLFTAFRQSLLSPVTNLGLFSIFHAEKKSRWSWMKLVKYLPPHNSLKCCYCFWGFRNSEILQRVKQHSSECRMWKATSRCTKQAHCNWALDNLAVRSFMVKQRLTGSLQFLCMTSSCPAEHKGPGKQLGLLEFNCRCLWIVIYWQLWPPSAHSSYCQGQLSFGSPFTVFKRHK